MMIHELSDRASLLNERIGILEMSAMGFPTLVKGIFRAISDILMLVRVGHLVLRPFFSSLISSINLPGQDDYQ